MPENILMHANWLEGVRTRSPKSGSFLYLAAGILLFSRQKLQRNPKTRSYLYFAAWEWENTASPAGHKKGWFSWPAHSFAAVGHENGVFSWPAHDFAAAGHKKWPISWPAHVWRPAGPGAGPVGGYLKYSSVILLKWKALSLSPQMRK